MILVIYWTSSSRREFVLLFTIGDGRILLYKASLNLLHYIFSISNFFKGYNRSIHCLTEGKLLF